MMTHRVHDTPVGKLLIVTSEEGVFRIAFECEDHELVLEQLEKVSPASGEIDQVMTEMDEYFAGVRREFSVPLDTTRIQSFQQKVLDYLPEIPYGSTLSYSEVADRIGHHNAMRSIGTACSTNPIPILIPCHRVIPASGRIGQFVGGPSAKRLMLHLEARSCSPSGSLLPY